MTQQREYTWQDLENAVGQDFSDGQWRLASEPVERGAIRMFCEALEMDCPLHYDDEAARKWGYKGTIAPHASISSTFTHTARWQPGARSRWDAPDREDAAYRQPPGNGERPVPMPRTTQGFLADLEIEYYRPVYVGDRLATRGHKLVSVAVKRTAVGYGAFMKFEREVINQDGELVAHIRNGSYRGNPVPKEGKG